MDKQIAADIWHMLSMYRWRILAALLCLITAKVASVIGRLKPAG